MGYIRYFILIGNFKGSAHCLNEINIRPKLYKNLSNGSQDIERTQYSKVKPMTLNCDFELESL